MVRGLGDVKARATGGRTGPRSRPGEKPEAGAGADTADGRGRKGLRSLRVDWPLLKGGQ